MCLGRVAHIRDELRLFAPFALSRTKLIGRFACGQLNFEAIVFLKLIIRLGECVEGSILPLAQGVLKCLQTKQTVEPPQNEGRSRTFVENIIVVVFVGPELTNFRKAKTMDGPDVHSAERHLLAWRRYSLQPTANSELHFFRRTLGEGKRYDVLLRHLLDTHPPADPASHDFRFAGARTGHNKYPSFRGFHRFSLLFGKPVEQHAVDTWHCTLPLMTLFFLSSLLICFA